MRHQASASAPLNAEPVRNGRRMSLPIALQAGEFDDDRCRFL
jgi:hypothetical protein